MDLKCTSLAWKYKIHDEQLINVEAKPTQATSPTRFKIGNNAIYFVLRFLSSSMHSFIT